MSGRNYSIPFTGTITNAGGNADLVYAIPATSKPMYLVGFRIGEYSDVGDAASEGVSITIERMTATVTVGSGGSAITPARPKTSDTAFGGTARANDTTVATTSGSTVILDELAWIIQNSPFETWYPDEDMQFCFIPGEALIIRLNTTVADDISASWTCFIREVG